MIETVLAVRYDGRVEQGRTSPLRVHVETVDGKGVDVILKTTNLQIGVEGLANEMLGSLLAGDLDIPTPEPFFVEIAPEFVASVAEADVRLRLEASCPLGFALADLGAGWRKWNATDHLTPLTVQTALQVIAFDAFIGNSDRSPKNPNIMQCKADSRFMVIDHECAFGFRMKLFPAVAPWELGNLQLLTRRGADCEHVFQLALAGRSGLPFAVVEEGWRGLPDVRFAAYDALLPDPWDAARPFVGDALRHFSAVRDSIPECITELSRILS